MLICDLACILWSRLNEDGKFYILKQVADHIGDEKKEGHRTLHQHLHHPEMVQFTKKVLECRYRRGRRDEYIRKFARTAELKMLGGQVESVDGLMVEFKGKMLPARICRCLDDSVVIEYADGEKEGEEELYTLTYNDGAGKRELLFDGSNGILKDGHGKEIKCALTKKRLHSEE